MSKIDTWEAPAVTVVRGSSRKASGSAVILMIPPALMLTSTSPRDMPPASLVVVILLGAMALLMLYRAIWPGRLAIDESGFSWRGDGKSWRVDWHEVARFRLVRMRFSRSLVIDYVDESPAASGRSQPRRPRTIPRMLELDASSVKYLLERSLRTARAAHPDEYVVPETVPALPEPRFAFPIVSLALLAVLTAVFAAEIAFPASPAAARWQPSIQTLVSFGASNWNLVVGRSQWYRIFTAPFLHANFQHLFFNGLALVIAGRLLEGMVGRAWFAAIYALGAVAGALVSLLLNDHALISVGASGAIMALFAATFVGSFHFPRSPARDRFQWRSIGVMAPTLLTIGKTADGMRVDFGAHLGGTIGGALVAAILLRLWKAGADRPPGRRMGAGIAAVGGVAAGLALLAATGIYDRLLPPNGLIPQKDMPGDAMLVLEAPLLERRYPEDPRPHLAQAARFLQQHNNEAAEKEARAGLATPRLHSDFAPMLAARLWEGLGQALAGESNRRQALDAFDQALKTDPTQYSVYYERGQARFGQGQIEPALADIRMADVHIANNSEVKFTEGNLLFAAGQIPLAIASYDDASKLDPVDANILWSRGMARFDDGLKDGALQDLTQAAKLDPGNLYIRIWLELISSRGGRGDRSLGVASKTWPGPIASLFAGDLGPTDVDKLVDQHTTKSSDQRCEANFYTGEWDLIHGQPGANDLLKLAAHECPPTFVESWAAKAELAR